MKISKNLKKKDKILLITAHEIEIGYYIGKIKGLYLFEFINTKRQYYCHDEVISRHFKDYKIKNPKEYTKFLFSPYNYDHHKDSIIHCDYLITEKDIKSLGYNINEIKKSLESLDDEMVNLTLGILINNLKLNIKK